ncbi:MAG: alpha/beta fold hydrolase [Mycobacteriales bacterium]
MLSRRSERPAAPDPIGPWECQDFSANGIRQHVAVAGAGPLVLLLHGFPEDWTAWRQQIPALVDAGFRAAAPDLRGYGGTDKPPRGYDPYTLAGDIGGLIRVLGEREAIVVGSDWGGIIAWTLAAVQPQVVRRLAILAMPHPLRLRQGVLTDPRGQLHASAYAVGFQAPRAAEAQLTRDGGAQVEHLMRMWSGSAWSASEDFAGAVRRYRSLIGQPAAAHCALEYYRWMMRAQFRSDGWRYRKLMSAPVTAPTLQLHGGADSCTLPRTAQGSSRYVAAAYEWRALDGVGHFPHEEAPETVAGELVRWAKEA